MTYQDLYKELPKCYLLKKLYDKCSQRYDVDFDFLGTVNNARKRVSSEVRQINWLFPEYTPHDEEYHLKRLFSVADEILSKKLIDDMNSTELLILSCSLYCHDWGMAVSETEKTAIVFPDRNKFNNSYLIDNEEEQFEKFLLQHGIRRIENKEIPIPIEIWRIYVRETHAIRSGKRAFKFFEDNDIGLADSVEKVCKGHWLEIKDISKYSSTCTVLNETVNLRALAIYVRLIDLLDITSYRTPYVIWKYVSPKDPYSKMEWEKHRAIQSLSTKKYQNGRAIQINGRTDDHEVYASLEDMKTWCDEQFKGCNDLLAEMNDNNHKLNIYNINWEIDTKGFIPTKIRYEFDREKMFEIFSSELYGDDSYVFLRELLQNSIDAIRMRRVFLKSRGVGADNIGIIKVVVKHQENGNIVVNWIDDGIGMNEYIIKNFFAIGGKSYYTSEEYMNQGLNMDAISRFGLGILSCFAVAEHIDIETSREQYCNPENQLLKITIPCITKHFRIEHHINTSNFTGTKVTVYIDKEKIMKNSSDNSPHKFVVTDYLKIIAGFVEFPIVINEDNVKTIILHPKVDDNVIIKRFDDTFTIHKISSNYPWTDVFLPQDVSLSKEVFIEQKYNIHELVDSEEYEGSITSLTVKGENTEITKEFSRHDSLVIVDMISKDKIEVRKKATRLYEKNGICESCKVNPIYAIYQNGILIPDESAPEYFYNFSNYHDIDILPLRIIINIINSKREKIDITRTYLLEQEETWDKLIKSCYVKQILKSNEKSICGSNILKNMHNIARLAINNDISTKDLWDVIDHDNWPIIILECNGEVRCHEFRDIKDEYIYSIPEFLNEKYDILVHKKVYSDESDNVTNVKWNGNKCFIKLNTSSNKYISYKKMGLINEIPILTYYQKSSVRFLSSLYNDKFPLLLEEWKRRTNINCTYDEEAILIKAFCNPFALMLDERNMLFTNIAEKYYYVLPEIVEFSTPFNNYFGYGLSKINFLHPLVQALIRIIAFLELEKKKPTIPAEQCGILVDIVEAFPNSFYDEMEYNFFADAIKLMSEKLCNLRLPNLKKIEILLPSYEDFIPGTIMNMNGNIIILPTKFDNNKAECQIGELYGATL